MNINQVKRQKRLRRHKRVRARIKGTTQSPRLSVFRSNKHMFLQLIDDEKERTLLAINDFDAAKTAKTKKTKTVRAHELGEKLAELALAKKIKKVVFDRGGRLYHGRVKAVAEGARKGGLIF